MNHVLNFLFRFLSFTHRHSHLMATALFVFTIFGTLPINGISWLRLHHLLHNWLHVYKWKSIGQNEGHIAVNRLEHSMTSRLNGSLVPSQHRLSMLQPITMGVFHVFHPWSKQNTTKKQIKHHRRECIQKGAVPVQWFRLWTNKHNEYARIWIHPICKNISLCLRGCTLFPFLVAAQKGSCVQSCKKVAACKKREQQLNNWQ